MVIYSIKNCVNYNMRSKIKKYSQSKGKSDFLLVSDNTIIGRTTVVLKISEHKESNLGDFVADGMVDWVSFLLLNIFTTEERK